MTRHEEKEYMYKILEAYQVEDGKVYDPTYDCLFTMDQAKRSIDIFIELADLREDESIIDFVENKIYTMPIEYQADLAIKTTDMLHDEKIINDDIYRKALANISMYKKLHACQ